MTGLISPKPMVSSRSVIAMKAIACFLSGTGAVTSAL
jgi:hypothetical protein